MKSPATALLVTLAIGMLSPAATGHAQVSAPRRTQLQASPGAFDRDVQPVLREYCSPCHNDKKANAGVNMTVFGDPASLASTRDGWEMILAKLRAGEMPPLEEEQPGDKERTALVTFVQRALDRADRSMKPDPGRVPIHRLTRVEYANTVRDLLGVDVRATEEFPADDSGYGFDNIGDILTVSPALMQKYLAAAERIAARAVGGDPWPEPGFFTRRARVRRIGDGTVELKDILEYDADYVIKVSLTGHRGPEDPPLTLVISVDGKPVKTVSVPVQISAVNRQGGATQRAVQEVRMFLTGNEHVFRAAFVNDEGLKKIPAKSRTDVNQNIFPEFIDVGGPYPPAEPQKVQKGVLVCDPASGAACVDRILTRLARRAYRRPVRRAEVIRLTNVFAKAKASGYTPAQSLQFAIATVLVSPQFLFRIERDPGPGVIARVSDVELASRLSYFLWSSMPDEELLRLGETGRLHLPAVLAAQVKRMIADPKSGAIADNFAGQWLETRSLDAVTRDATRFPEWGNELKDAMRTETRLFFDAVLRENRPVSDFIDGKYSFVNGLLAKHYGIADVDGADFRRVELTGGQRSGVFTQGSVLTVSSYPTRTSVVLRGKYLLENVFNAPPPPPPDDVPTLDEAAIGVAKSHRAQLEQHRADSLCASCHDKLDPLGFALENYDAIGRWRTEDGKFPVDSTGTLPSGKKFSGSAELKTLLLDRMNDFTRGLAEKMLTYALGRGVESYDRLVVRDLVRQSAAHGYRLQSLIQAIVKSVPFQQRRGEHKPLVKEARGQ
jgi:Protein of unknown function (DUF1592)/Protein of unknown function (DUF1588)/Protein of unknown function (DUF1587)/Protein of unknown function (DUF1585)/Protein of unknown function (DUF1595)